MTVVVWVILLLGGLWGGPRVFRAILASTWGENFSVDALKSFLAAVVVGSSEKFYEATEKLSPTPRLQQLWLAFNSLSWAWLMVMMLLVQSPFFMLQPLFDIIRTMVDINDPPAWLFWLSSSDWSGMSLGLGIGAFVRIGCRFTGFSLSLATVFLMMGWISMPAAWGVFLGDLLLGGLENYAKFKAPLFRYKTKISLAFGLGGLILSPLVLSFSMSMLAGTYSTQLRWIQWFFMIVILLFCETMTSALFFHFYWQRQQKREGRLTKV